MISTTQPHTARRGENVAQVEVRCLGRYCAGKILCQDEDAQRGQCHDNVRRRMVTLVLLCREDSVGRRVALCRVDNVGTRVTMSLRRGNQDKDCP